MWHLTKSHLGHVLLSMELQMIVALAMTKRIGLPHYLSFLNEQTMRFSDAGCITVKFCVEEIPWSLVIQGTAPTFYKKMSFPMLLIHRILLQCKSPCS